MSRRKSKGLVPAHGDGPGRRKVFGLPIVATALL